MDQATGVSITPKQGWSWGGLLFNWSFLIAVKRYKMLWWFILAFVPFVNIIFWIVMAIYMGMNGHKVAAEGTQFANQSEYDGFIKGVDHAGKVGFFVVLVIAIVALCFVMLGFVPLWLNAHPAMIQAQGY